MKRKWWKYSIVMTFCFLKYAAMGQEPGTLGLSVLQLYASRDAGLQSARRLLRQ